MEELVEVEEDARHVGDEEHADDAHQDHPQLQVLGLKQTERWIYWGPVYGPHVVARILQAI